jgi:hypothetical protein
MSPRRCQSVCSIHRRILGGAFRPTFLHCLATSVAETTVRRHGPILARRAAMRLLAIGLLALVGVFVAPSLVAAGSSPSPAQADVISVGQQPVSTIPPGPQPSTPRFSTIPPLPPTSTPILVVPTQAPNPSPAPTRPAPVIPTPVPVRPTAPIAAPSQATPRAGGFPTEVALMVFAGSATALGGGLYLFDRSRKR